MIHGKDQCRFWARALKFDEELELVQKMMLAPGPRKFAAVPIIAQYEVEPDYHFYYCIVLKVDSLGIQNGEGVIWIADRACEKKVCEDRDKLAGQWLEHMHKERKFDEVLDMPTKKE